MVLDELLEQKLMYGAYLQTIERWKRNKELPKYNFCFMLIGLTRAVVYSKVIALIEKKFSHIEFLAYTNPVLNISGTHEDQLKKHIQ